jgi:hypothetical protein
MNNNAEKKISDSISELLATIITWFVSAGFIMWGWNTIAPHINCPLFTYWEIFAMRMGLSYLMAIIWQKKN